MMQNEDLEKLGHHIVNIMPDEPLEALSILCTCIEWYGSRLGFTNEDTWKMVNEVRINVANEMGEYGNES